MNTTSPELVQEEKVEYAIEPRLKKNLDVIRHRILSRDKDYVMVVDGGEGTGKSTLAIQMGKYVDDSLCLERITFTGEDFRKEPSSELKKGSASSMTRQSRAYLQLNRCQKSIIC
jgi:pantothenate kinase-related protein Tda10